jgi:hypothetical protein
MLSEEQIMTNTELLDYAFIDVNGTVLNVCVFAGHDENLLETIKNSLNASAYISCKDNGLAAIGGTWDGQYFKYEDGTRVPLTPMPQDDTYIYRFDFDSNEWVIATTNKLKDLT